MRPAMICNCFIRATLWHRANCLGPGVLMCALGAARCSCGTESKPMFADS